MYCERVGQLKSYARQAVLAALWAASACDDGGSAADRPGEDASSAASEQQHDAGQLQCQVPLECRAVDTAALYLRPCCTSTIACGFELVRPEELRPLVYGSDPLQIPDTPEGRCVALDKIFLTPEGRPERRVAVPGAEPIFYTPECATRAILAYPFVGCCMASGECGLSTNVALTSLGILALPNASPITRAECTTAQKINEAFLASSFFAGFAHLEETSGRCDFAGLAGRLSSTSE